MVADTAKNIVEEIVLATCIVLKGNNYDHVFLANVKRFFYDCIHSGFVDYRV